MTRSLICAALLLPALALGEVRAADLDKAARQVSDQKYEAASRTLDAAWKQSGNKREAVLRILELQGVAAAHLGQDTKARSTFQMLLTLDPKHELAVKFGAKAMKAFSDAQAWAADNPPLEMTAEPAATDPTGKVLQIAVKVKSDSLKAAKKVRFQVRSDGGKWVEQLVEVQGGYGSANTDSDRIEWYAELLGEREMVLLHVGTQKQPVKEGKLKEKEPAQVAAAPAKPEPEKKKEPEKPADPPKAEKKPELTPQPDPGRERERSEPEVVERTEPTSNGSEAIRAIGYASLAVGIASAVAGTVMGALWRSNVNTLNEKLRTATRQGMDIVAFEGVPAGGAQSYYFGMTDRIRTQAIAANVLWAAGGGLAVLGIILYVVGREDVSAGSGGLVYSF